MGAVASVSGARPVAVGAVGPGIRGGTEPTLLPVPDPAGLADVDAGLTAMYALQIKMSALAVRDGDIKAASNREASKAELQVVKDAIRRQRAAERKANGFWGKFKKVASTIAKVAGVVAAAAAVACSGGTAVPLVVGVAALALSAGGMAVRELKLLGKDSDKIGMGMEIAGAAIGLGGAAAAAFGIGAAAAAGGSSAIRTVGTGATLANAGATGASATATVVIADHQRDADHAAADAEQARLAMDRLQTEAKMIVESCEEGLEASKDALCSTEQALEACNQAADVAIAGVKG